MTGMEKIEIYAKEQKRKIPMTLNKNDACVYTCSGSNPNNITSISDVYYALFYGVRSDPT